MAKEKRPLFVTILGIIYLLIFLLIVIAGVIICVFANNVDLYNMGLSEDVIKQIEELLKETGMSLSSIFITFGAIDIAIGCVYGVVAAGFFKGWWFMWYLGVIINALSLIITIVELCNVTVASGFIKAVITIILLLYLFKPNVKKYFLNR